MISILKRLEIIQIVAFKLKFITVNVGEVENLVPHNNTFPDDFLFRNKIMSFHDYFAVPGSFMASVCYFVTVFIPFTACLAVGIIPGFQDFTADDIGVSPV